MLRWLIPYRRSSFETSLAPTAAADALRERVSTPKGLLGGYGPWYGRIEDGGFRFRRTIAYRNSFLPIVHGTITATPVGSRISVTMRMPWFTTAFLAVWLGFTLYLAGQEALASGLRSSLGTSLPFLLFALLPGPAFGFEAAKAERLLEDVFGAA